MYRQIFESFGRWFIGTIEEAKFTGKVEFRIDKVIAESEEDVYKTFGEWFQNQISSYRPGTEFKPDFYVPGFVSKPETVFKGCTKTKDKVSWHNISSRQKLPEDFIRKVRSNQPTYIDGIPHYWVAPYEKRDGVSVRGHYRKYKGY